MYRTVDKNYFKKNNEVIVFITIALDTLKLNHLNYRKHPQISRTLNFATQILQKKNVS